MFIWNFYTVSNAPHKLWRLLIFADFNSSNNTTYLQTLFQQATSFCRVALSWYWSRQTFSADI